MNINGTVHCFFEQSGTFKNEFRKLGFQAFDYDIQNNFGETDREIDLFKEIDVAFAGGASVFDEIQKDDLIIAFYPCTFFCAFSQMAFSFGYTNYKCMDQRQKTNAILKRSKNRADYYDRLIKLVSICIERGFRLILENPWSEQTYLKANFVKPPDLIDNNRLLRGDYYKKPTAYWFWNCTPTNGQTFQKDKEPKTIHNARQSKITGICSEERSMISPDYARNFICDFILGKNQTGTQINILNEYKLDGEA